MRRFKRRQKMLRLTVLPALLLSALLPSLRERASAQDAPLIKPVKIYDEPAKPLLDDKDHVSTNISGIGCLPRGLFFHRGRASLSRFETVANDRR